MRLFWELARLSFQRQLTYRAAAMAGLTTNVFFGFLRAAVLIALYNQRPAVAGMSLEEAITYTGFTQAIIAYMSIFGWYEVMHSVYSGEVATDLLKPMNYFSFWLAQDLGRAASNFLLRGLTIMLIYALVFDITVPSGPGHWLALAVSLILGLLISFAWRFWVNLAAFWTPNAVGVGRFTFGIIWIMSGFIMPLRFFPDWFVTICEFTPFPAMINTSIEVYLGLLSGPAMLQAMAWQLFWFIILAAAGQLTLRVAVHRLVIQGG